MCVGVGVGVSGCVGECACVYVCTCRYLGVCLCGYECWCMRNFCVCRGGGGCGCVPGCHGSVVYMSVSVGH